MFSFLTKKCFSKSNRVEINRNIRRDTAVTISYAFSCNKQEIFLKNEQKWTRRKLLDVKKYISISAADKNELQDFTAVFPDILKDLTISGHIVTLPGVSKWFSMVLQHNVTNGNKVRSFTLMQSYRMLAKPEHQTPENIRLVMILGWCVELFAASFIINDDIMDGSETRRGAPCWYKRDEVGLAAINDTFLLTGGYYALLRKYFQHKPYYVKILNMFQDTLLNTAIGQSLEFRTAQINNPKLELFTMERYKSFATYKIGFATFVLPVELGMCLAEHTADMHQAKPILLDMGYLHQIQNDFKDCFGDPTVTGKIGTDIQEGLCTWLAVVALQKASPEQRKLMEECYGSSDPQKVAAVKNLYNELNLPNEYAVHKDNTLNMVQTNIQKISNDQLRKLVLQIFEELKEKLAYM